MSDIPEKSLDYRQSGVDIEAGYESVRLIKGAVASTMRPEVLSELGGFAGAFSLAKIKNMKDPVLLSGTDGVGTKIQLAFETGRHDTIGIDCVAMCVNDIAAMGAEPLFFLDYIACGKNYPEKIARIVKGVAEGCRQSGCALIGGETAEHPGLMPEEDYDLAGFAVGLAEREEMIDGKDIAQGDVLIGVKISGVHSNGFSLVRKILQTAGISANDEVPALGGKAGDILLTPTRIYVAMFAALKKAGIRVLGASHITCGGFYENVPRMLPEGTRAVIQKDSCEVPPLFSWLQAMGHVEEHVMYNTFNMGTGMVLAVRPEVAEQAVSVINSAGESAFICGQVIQGEKGIDLC